jgi:hypothetical protein
LKYVSLAFSANSYLKNHLDVEAHVNVKGMKNIDLHVTMCCIVLLAMALTRLQHGIKKNLSSVAYLMCEKVTKCFEEALVSALSTATYLNHQWNNKLLMFERTCGW